MKITEILVNSFKSPLGIDSPAPTFSWKLASKKQNTLQTAYQIKVFTNDSLVWDSQKKFSQQSIYNKYGGPQLTPKTSYRVEVTVWDNQQEAATATTFFETGLLGGKNFTAKMIGLTADTQVKNCPKFFSAFTCDQTVAKARLYISALGIYEAYLNQRKVGDAFFTPGWTSYHQRIQYQTFDVTKLLQAQNEISIIVGNGWYKGAIGFMPEPNHYGKAVGVIAELELTYQDGSSKIIATNGQNWHVTDSQIKKSEFYDGEDSDSTFKSELEEPVQVLEFDREKLFAQEDELVRVVQKLPVKKLIKTPKGETVLDFGQNIAGFVDFKVKGQNGQNLKLRHAESLDENGNFYTGNLSFAKAEDNYVCDGTQQEFHPHFTYHGFRYAALEGFQSDISIENFTAWALSTDLPQTGYFKTSNKLINQLQSNINWSQRDNFIDIPTDCPQRSERLGWTGDVSAFCHTAVFNRKADNFFDKWLHDLASESNSQNGTPQVVPNIMPEQQAASFWGDVATILPWRLYQTYGNKERLQSYYPLMKSWIEYIHNHVNDNGLWQDGYQYGDWLALDAEWEGLTDERNGATDSYLIANVFYLHSLDLVIKAAKELALNDDQEFYQKLQAKVLTAFKREYITSTGRLVSETQTACALLLHFNLAPVEDRPRILKTLVTNLAAHKNHITTGFVGTPFICHVLSENGQHDLARKILLTEDCPSWLYEVTMGATTIWERWDSILPDGSFNPKNMNSLNHYAYGSIGDWMYRKIGGLNELAPGYQKFELRPLLTNGFTAVALSFDSVYGNIECNWQCDDGKIKVAVTVPVNTTAIVYLPEKDQPIELGSGHYEYEYSTETNLKIAKYSLETPLHVVLDNPAAKAFLDQAAPGMTDNKMLEYVKNEPLSTLLSYSAEAKPLFEKVVEIMNQSEKD